MIAWLRNSRRTGADREPPIEGVIQHNPFPLREVPPGGNLASAQKDTPKGKVYDFSKIGSTAQEQLKNGVPLPWSRRLITSHSEQDQHADVPG